MSEWMSMAGMITIPKKYKVSLQKLIKLHFTDEASISVKSESIGEYWYHTFEALLEIDGTNFLKKWPDFEKELHATRKDITCVLRFLLLCYKKIFARRN